MAHDDSDRLEVIASLRHELEAAPIVAALDAEGIRAEAVGAYTAGFRAEAPGEVQVVVRGTDAERARAVLAELRSRSPEDPEEDSPEE